MAQTLYSFFHSKLLQMVQYIWLVYNFYISYILKSMCIEIFQALEFYRNDLFHCLVIILLRLSAFPVLLRR